MIPDLSSILVVLHFGCAMMCVLLAVVGAAWFASYLAPLDPSTAESSVRHETYTHTQYKLACVRARRRALLSHIEDLVLSSDGHEATRPITIPSIPRREEPTRKIHTSPVMVGMCVKVGEPPTATEMCERDIPPPTLSDIVTRALTLAHMRRHVA